MASKNVFVGEIGTEEQVAEVRPAPRRAPAWRYSKDCPAGKVIKTDEELDRLDAAGWKDHPGKVRLLVGHESLFEDESVTTSKIDSSGKKKLRKKR